MKIGLSGMIHSIPRYPKSAAFHQNNVLGAARFLPQHPLFCYIDPLIFNIEFL